jgi:NTP pyrophosphatase (non-canonical NTP hydrolase)
MTFREIQLQVRELNQEFAKLEQRKWGVEGTMIELMKQIGDLAKRLMVFENFKSRETNPDFATNKENIGDELADIVSVCMRLADEYDIDLEEAIMKSVTNAKEVLKKVQ